MEELLGSLDALLHLLGRQPQTLHSAARLQDAADALELAGEGLERLRWDGQARRRLGSCRSKLARLGELLVRFEAQAQRAIQQAGSPGAVRAQVGAALCALFSAARLVAPAQPEAAEKLALARGGAALLLGSGRALLADPSWEVQEEARLNHVGAAFGLIDNGRCPEVAHAFPPAQTLPWLTAVAHSMEQHPAPASDSGHLERFWHTTSLTILLTSDHPAFGGLQAAVRGCPSLQRQLVELVAGSLGPAADRVLANTEERLRLRLRPGPAAAASSAGAGALEWPDQPWHHVLLAASLLCAPCLLPAAHEFLRRGHGRSAVLQAAAKLGQELPVAVPPGIDPGLFGGAWLAQANLFGLAMSAASAAPPGRALQRAGRDAAAWAAVRMMPRMAEALQGLASMPGVQLASLVWGYIDAQARPDDPNDFMNSVPAVHSMEQLELLLPAVDACLRLLPHLAASLPTGLAEGDWTFARVQQAMGAEEGGVVGGYFSTCVSAFASGALLQVASFASSMAGMQQAAGLALHVLKLHTSVCRLVFWLASLAPARRDCLLVFLNGWPTVLNLLYDASMLVKWRFTMAANLAGAEGLCTPVRRHRQAAHAVMWQALQELQAHMGHPSDWQPPRLTVWRDWAILSLAAIMYGPDSLLGPAVASEVQLAVELAHKPDLEFKLRTDLACMVSLAALDSPRVCSLLLTSGGTERVADLFFTLLTTQAHTGSAAGRQTGPASQQGMLLVLEAARKFVDSLSVLLACCKHAAADRAAAEAALPPSQRVGQGLAAQLAGAAARLGRELDGVETGCTEIVLLSIAQLANSGDALLQAARGAAGLLQQYWATPEQVAAARLEQAQAAASRSCAYLRCANLTEGGGVLAGQGEGSRRCAACRQAWYCNTDCSHADWRGPEGHRRVCAALAAERLRERASAAAGEAGSRG